jgi:ribosomal protein S12 methylthiotransferase
VEVLVEGERGPGRLVGRTGTQAPAIDGVVRLSGEAAPGDVVPARITGAEVYDLRAEVLGTAVDSAASGL